jgi:hypothetical protein
MIRFPVKIRYRLQLATMKNTKTLALGILINLLAWSSYGQGKRGHRVGAILQAAINNPAAPRPPAIRRCFTQSLLSPPMTVSWLWKAGAGRTRVRQLFPAGAVNLF